MIQEIKYGGVTSSPSDYDCPDGDIAAMINVTNENGSLLPVAPPETLFTLEKGRKVIYIHKTSDYCNYIIHESGDDMNNGKVCYFSDGSSEVKDILPLSGKELYQINSIGNTLVVLTSERVFYAIYKSGSYVIMEDRPEFPAISFSLRGTIENADGIDISFDPFYFSGIVGSLIPDNASNAIKEKILAYANSTSSKVTTSGKFQFPFMIRYAYRMYDGSLYMHSAPANMLPSQGIPFLLHITGTSTNNGELYQITVSPRNVSANLYYKIINADSVKKSLEQWRDIVKSIDIFITESYKFYDPESKFKMFVGNMTGGNLPDARVFSFMNKGEVDSSGELIHRKIDLLAESFDSLNYFIPLDCKENEAMASVFRHISTIKIGDINGEDSKVVIGDGVLSSLGSRESMPGDSMQFDTVIAKYSFTYNSRLNLAGISTIPRQVPLESCFQYLNGEYDTASKKGIKKVYSYKAYVFIQSGKMDVMVENIGNMGLNIESGFFFYPNANAFRLVIERVDGSGNKMYSDTKLIEHEQLNGAFTRGFAGFTSSFDSSVLSGENRTLSYPNKIYTSDVNNPFVFPSTGINAVGSGEIVGLRSATKALSQGQFGQFPLYAFTDEGVWALEVSETGGYSAKQPATRDVCNNPDSITQVDNAVLFSTNRGIMMIQGSESICLSDIINDNGFAVSGLQGFDNLINLAGFESGQFEFISFPEYIEKCEMSYDYKNQRIVIFNKEYPYAYVFSFRSKTWSFIASDFSSAVNSYPDSYIMTTNNRLINISITDNGQLRDIPGMVVTRPIKFGSPDLLKTIDTCIHRGVFPIGSVKTVLYGSRDLINWFVVSSSKNHYLRMMGGTPFKYFRFVIIMNFSSGHSLSGTSVSLETRQTNKLR